MATILLMVTRRLILSVTHVNDGAKAQYKNANRLTHVQGRTQKVVDFLTNFAAVGDAVIVKVRQAKRKPLLAADGQLGTDRMVLAHHAKVKVGCVLAKELLGTQLALLAVPCGAKKERKEKKITK